MIVEIVGNGFDAESDKTDGRILWVEVESSRWLEKRLSGTGTYVSMEELDPSLAMDDEDIDYRLPDGFGAMLARLQEWADDVPSAMPASGEVAALVGKAED